MALLKGSGIASLVRKVGQESHKISSEDKDSSANIFSVIDYVEQPWGLNMRLYPGQRFLVKLYYHIPLEEREKTITITDMYNTKVLFQFTEKEYLHFLFEEGRCNIREQDHERRDLVLAIGRRAGKTSLSALFASYEVYRLLNLRNPQEYYGLPNGNRIQIISVATDKDQAGILYNDVTTHIAKCDYFQPHLANNTLSYVNFRTPYDIERFGPTQRGWDGKFTSFNGKATLRLTFKSCIAKGLRGSGNIVVILDEMAHFQTAGQASAKEIYDAVTPSTAAFSPKDRKGNPRGPIEARVICISSPLGREGKFYELFDLAMRGGPGAENLLAIQAPTWEINPTVPASYYRRKYHEDPTTFMVEHGAQFSDQIRGWIEREADIEACIDVNLRPKSRGLPKAPHQMGVDVGLVGDGTFVVITHAENDRIVLDYHEGWYAGIPWRETNPHLEEPTTAYARQLSEYERLDFDSIAEWIESLCKRFYITAGLFDRWNGIPLEQSLHKMGLRQFKSEFFSRDQSSKIYQTAKMLMFDERLVFYDYPKQAGSKHSALVTELLRLQVSHLSKNMTLVEAPKIGGAHDDAADALVRAIWLTHEQISNQKIVSRGSSTQPYISAPGSLRSYQIGRTRVHGAIKERTIPRRGASSFR